PVLAARAPGAQAGDDQLLDGDEQVLQGVLASLADGQGGLGEVLAVAAGQHQVRATLVELLGEAEVLHVALAGAGAAADPGRAEVGDAPGPGEAVDLVLVDLVPRLPLQLPDLDEHIHRHDATTSRGCLPARTGGAGRRAAAAGLAWSTRARTSTTP